MRDARTCYRFERRAYLRDLLKRDPDTEQDSVPAEVAMWNGVASVFGDFKPIGLRFIGRGAIACVEQDPLEPPTSVDAEPDDEAELTLRGGF